MALCLIGLTPALGQTPPPPPSEPVQQEPLPETTIIPQPAQAAVQVQALSAPDVFSPGARDTGLGSDVWRGSSSDMAREILPELGKRALSPAASAMARRLLATGASAPEGASDDFDLAAARLGALLLLGDAAAVEAMIERTPGANISPALAQIQAEAAMILGHTEKACHAADAISSRRDDPFWLRLRSYCQALNGQMAASSLTLGLAEAQKPDPVFAHLMGQLLAGGKARTGASLRSGLDLALSRTLGLDLGTAISAAPAPIVIALARDPATEPDLRLLAAGRAMRFGAHLDDVFAQVASQPSLPPIAADGTQPPPPPLDIPALIKLQGTAAEARLLAIGRDTNDLALREQLVTNLLKRPQTLGDFLAMARLTAPQIASLAKANAPTAAPVLLATAALITGDVETGSQIRQGLPADMASDEVLLLDAMLTLAKGPTDPDRQAVLARLAAATQTLPGQGLLARRQTAALLTAALTAHIAAPVRNQLAQLDTGRLEAPAARLFALDLAAGDQLKAESILSALAILNASGAQGPKLNDRVRLVRGLGLAGLGPDATALAMEGIVLSQGFASPPAATTKPTIKPLAKPKPKPRPAPKPRPTASNS
jgi:hypothetical protein